MPPAVSLPLCVVRALRVSETAAAPVRRMQKLKPLLLLVAENGKTNRAGVPTPLRFAVLPAENPGFLYLEKPPVRVQKAAIRALAPLGRALGYGRRDATGSNPTCPVAVVNMPERV
jgi:hypothetical protein